MPIVFVEIWKAGMISIGESGMTPVDNPSATACKIWREAVRHMIFIIAAPACPPLVTFLLLHHWMKQVLSIDNILRDNKCLRNIAKISTTFGLIMALVVLSLGRPLVSNQIWDGFLQSPISVKTAAECISCLGSEHSKITVPLSIVHY